MHRMIWTRSVIAMLAISSVVSLTYVSFLILRRANETKLTVAASDSRFTVNLKQPWMDNSMGFFVELCHHRDCEKVYDHRREHPGADFYVHFAQVAWCSSPKAFAVFATGTDVVKFAYDLERSTPINFEHVERCMEEAIRSEYSLPHDMGNGYEGTITPIYWASFEGKRAFHNKYPNSVSTSRIWGLLRAFTR